MNRAVKRITWEIEGPANDIEWALRGLDCDERAAVMDWLCSRVCAWPSDKRALAAVVEPKEEGA